MRISDWSSDVCSSDLAAGLAEADEFGKLRLDDRVGAGAERLREQKPETDHQFGVDAVADLGFEMHPVELALRIPFCMIGIADMLDLAPGNEHIVEIGHRIEFVADRGERPVIRRSEEHTSELQSLMRK